MLIQNMDCDKNIYIKFFLFPPPPSCICTHATSNAKFINLQQKYAFGIRSTREGENVNNF